MNKYIDCKDCEKMYHCDRTYMGGCFNGKEFDKDINVRSKDDSEIDVGMFDESILAEATEAVKNNQNAGVYVGDLLRIIHRLQEEIENRKKVDKHKTEVIDEYCTKNAEQKAEIERLSRDWVVKAYDKLRGEKAELKKKVDEWNSAFIPTRAKQQAVKDTAKEILTEISESDILVVNTQEYGEIEVVSMERLKEIVKSKGVEVE